MKKTRFVKGQLVRFKTANGNSPSGVYKVMEVDTVGREDGGRFSHDTFVTLEGWGRNPVDGDDLALA